METKRKEWHLKTFRLLLAAAFAVLTGRLAYLELYQADKYQTLARQNHLRLITINAPRGEISDRNGVRMVGNRAVFTVSLAYLGLKDTSRVIERLSRLLSGEKPFQDMTAAEIAAGISKKMKNEVRLYQPVQVAENVSPQTVSRIGEHRLELPGVLIDVESVRDYRYGDLLVPALGYVGEINQDELDAHQGEDYRPGDMYGKDGLENAFQSDLHGKNGARQVEVDAKGRPVRDLGIKEPVPGNNLMLTVDARLQRAAQDALVRGIARARREGFARGGAGAAVVLDVRTGAVLALVSQPTYDPSIFTGGPTKKQWQAVMETQALNNRALSPYPPGSTFKMVVAAAALESGKITPDFSIYDPGYFKYKTDWNPAGHGRVNVTRALKVSCDTFFWTVGLLTGPETIARYAGELGLGQKTGIELPGEKEGRIPSKEAKYKFWKNVLNNLHKEIDRIKSEYNARPAGPAPDRELNSRLAPLLARENQIKWELDWHEYDTLDMSIGQGDSYYSPLQLANYVAAIANGGALYRPFLVQKVIAPDGQVVRQIEPRLIRRVNISAHTLQIIREGMHEVTLPPEGTAAGVFAGAAYTAGAKTGTAEVQGHDNHALFVAFAPYERPEVALAVVVDYGGHGGTAAGSVGREILDAWFSLANAPATRGLCADGVKPQAGILQ